MVRGTYMSKALLDGVILKYIDAKLIVDGHVNATDLKKIFNISRPKSSRIFSQYRSVSPNNMVHSVSERRYVIDESAFTSTYLKGYKPEDYINSINMIFSNM